MTYSFHGRPARTETWAKTEDGETRTLYVEVHADTHGHGEAVIVTYKLMASFLRQLGFDRDLDKPPPEEEP